MVYVETATYIIKLFTLSGRPVSLIFWAASASEMPNRGLNTGASDESVFLEQHVHISCWRGICTGSHHVTSDDLESLLNGNYSNWRHLYLFALINVSSFAALMRKLIYSFLSSLYKCNNSLIHTTMNSHIFSVTSFQEVILFYLFSFLFYWFVLFYFLVCMGSESATE